MRADAPVSIVMRLPRDVASLRLARTLADGVLAACGANADCREDLSVALTEACGNVILHAGTAPGFEVALHVEEDLCTAEVTDHGDGFLPNGPPTLPSATTVSGRGLYIIAQLTDHVEVDSQPGQGTRLRFVKRLQRSATSS